MSAREEGVTSPGASGPGEPGYEGEATVGDEGAWLEDADEADPTEPPE